MEKRYQEDVKNSVGRVLFAGIACILQVLWLLVTLLQLYRHYAVLSALVHILTIFVVLRLFGKHSNTTIKLSWIVFIMAAPLFGLAFYLLSTGSNFVRTMGKRFQTIDRALFPLLGQDPEALQHLREDNVGAANQAYFLRNTAGFPVYEDTAVRYFSEASEGLEAQKAALRRAESFIFMEYHAIEDREAFGELAEILAERAAHGVEVRLFYDDVGSLGFVSRQFLRKMQSLGIQCRVFNPVVPFFNIFMNNRDHRKLTVIDGRVGFTGGYNLADEYFNITHPLGYWKDTGLMLEGGAVRTLTVLFWEMWNAMNRRGLEDIRPYLLPADAFPALPGQGFVQPYGDSPLDEKRTGEDVYLNLLKNARRYVFIMTPYLIITDDMTRELTLCARRGVDVRIITPGVPDKKLIYQMTRSYYGALAREGVRIYEYTPGFCHAKMMVSDDELAVVGTINLDYRSLYHHFENAVLLCGCPCVAEIRDDLLACIAVSREVTARYGSERSAALRMGQCVLRLFAPLM